MVSDYFGHLGYRHKSAHVRFAYNAFELVYLNAGDNAVQNRFCAAGNKTLGRDKRAGAPELLIDRVGNVGRVVGDYHCCLGLLHALLNDVDQLKGNEICQQRQHSPVPTEENAGGYVDENVYHEYDLTGRCADVFGKQHRGDLGAV